MPRWWDNELQFVLDQADAKKPIVITRWGDGELALMHGSPVGEGSQAWTADRWKWEGGKSKLGSDLVRALRHKEPEWYYGLPCPECNLNSLNTYLSLIKQKNDNLTYANLFINEHWQAFLEWAMKKGEAVNLVCNGEVGKRRPIGKRPVKYLYAVQDDAVNYWEAQGDQIAKELALRAQEDPGALWFVVAGPMAEPIIDKLWEADPTGRYLDIGSALDEWAYGFKTRPYMFPECHYAKHRCWAWDDDYLGLSRGSMVESIESESD